MKYAISDLHGRNDEYLKILEIINFGDEDELYIIGDLCDRGPDSAKILLDVMERENVHCISGNHEQMLLEALPNTFYFLQKQYGKYATLDTETWNACGGASTCISFMLAGRDKIADIYSFILSLPFYKVVNVNERKYLLVHAGLHNYKESKRLCDYLPEELVWFDCDYNGTYYPQLFDKVIVGHTPTFLLNSSKPATIFHGKGNVIDIDCGCVFEEDGGRLGCLCLDTLEEFYV